jgi:hypothetical protein
MRFYLHTLPRDLSDIVIRFCDFETVYLLACTNRQFWQTIVKSGTYLSRLVHVPLKRFEFDTQDFLEALRSSDGMIAPSTFRWLLQPVCVKSLDLYLVYSKPMKTF